MLYVIDIKERKWIEFVEGSSYATIFHQPLWPELLANSYGYRSIGVVLEDLEGQIIAGLPMMEINSWLTGKRWVALPFTDHCRPLLQNKNDLELFTGELIRKNKEINSAGIEVRQALPHMNGIVYQNTNYIHYLKLDKKPEELFKNFRKKGVQYCIKKAAKSDIDISQSTKFDSLMKFYKLHLMTRKKHGVPTQPKKYFIKLWENIINQGMGFVMLAHHKDKAIAGGVFLHYNKNMIYKYGAADPDYMNLYATHALLWEVIQWACNNGYEIMDWGKTEKSNQGLRNFKRGWGTEEKELIYSYIGNSPKEYSGGWKKKAVEKVIQKSPVWVGRIIGEMLYKHVG